MTGRENTDFKTPRQIAFTTCAIDPSSPLEAHVSVSMKDEEAKDLMGSFSLPDLGGDTGPDAKDLNKLLDALDGRFLIAFADRRKPVLAIVSHLFFPNRSVNVEEQAAGRDLHHPFSGALKEYLASDFASKTDALDRILADRDAGAILGILEGFLDRPEAIADHIEFHRGEIAERIERFRPTRLLAQIDGTEALDMIHAHLDSWGRRHRLIEAIVFSPGAACAYVHPNPHLDTWYRPVPHEGFWKAWRQSRPIAFVTTENRPTFQLARMIGQAAILLHGRSDHDSEPARIVVERNFYGQTPFSDRQVETAAERHRIETEESLRRDTLRDLKCAEEGSVNRALRIASRIRGHHLRSARDRLLMKMTGRGIDPRTLLPLRIEELDVLRTNELIARSSGTDAATYLMDSADEADLWTLVRANETLEGHLFSPIGSAERYGRRALSESELVSVAAERSAEVLAVDPAAKTSA